MAGIPTAGSAQGFLKHLSFSLEVVKKRSFLACGSCLVASLCDFCLKEGFNAKACP